MLSIDHSYLGGNPMHQMWKTIGGNAVLLAAAGLVSTPSHAAKVGEHYIVDGRCVTVTAVRQAQAYYEWSKGNASGGGDLPASRLTQRCEAAPKSVAPRAAAARGENVAAIRAPGAEARSTHRASSDRLDLTAAEAKAMVYAHNSVRAQVGVGPVAWDAALASFAQRYVATLVRSCALKHSAGSGFGENLAAWTQHAPPTQAVDLWAREKAVYRGAGGPLRGADMEAGHYTQVVWRGTTRVGCGRTMCSKNGVDWTLVSCNYSPAGNVMGSRVY
jgi:pathogenesis-related protein 1